MREPKGYSEQEQKLVAQYGSIESAQEEKLRILRGFLADAGLESELCRNYFVWPSREKETELEGEYKDIMNALKSVVRPTNIFNSCVTAEGKIFVRVGFDFFTYGLFIKKRGA